MLPIKLKFLNSYNACILLLMSFLGFSTACKKEEVRYEYGVPNAGFIINGKIESVLTSKPIPDIIIEVREMRLVKTGFSDGNGKYQITIGDSPDDKTYQLRFSDTDGPLNGEYESLDTTVVFNDPKFRDGDGKWFVGYTEQELNIKLLPKK